MEIIIVVLLLGMGAALFFVGSLMSALVAIGNKQYVFGFATFFFIPLSLIYCVLNWKIASYSGKLVYSGFSICIVSYLIFSTYTGSL